MVILVILIIFLVIISLILLTKWNIDSAIYFNHSSVHCSVCVQCFIFKMDFRVFRLEKKILFGELFRKKQETDIEKKIKQAEKKKEKKKKPNIRFILRLVKSVLSAVELRKFSIRILIGTGDAAKTAMLCGMTNAIAGNVIGISSNFMKEVGVVKIESTPDFTKDILKGDFSCIFFVKTADIIISAFSNLILRRVK